VIILEVPIPPCAMAKMQALLVVEFPYVVMVTSILQPERIARLLVGLIQTCAMARMLAW
jgi:hypothetical protein